MLEQIFYYYHENKLNKKNGESKTSLDAYAKIFKEVESCSNNPEKTMDIVGLYGIEAEKEGFINGSGCGDRHSGTFIITHRQ